MGVFELNNSTGGGRYKLPYLNWTTACRGYGGGYLN